MKVSSCLARLLAGAILLCSSLAPAHASDPPAPPPEMAPQRASAADLHVFDPYIGRFRSKPAHDEKTGRTVHYIAEYRWFDPSQTIVKFTITTVDETDGKETLNAEGFYGYDPFNDRIYVLAAFSWGVTGFGSVGTFDLATHRRVTWARSRGSDGVVTYVRDAFEVVDANTWKNVTSIRHSADAGWQVVYRDTFSRIQE